MTAIALLFTLASIGIAETAYLIEKRKQAEKPVCPIGGGCHIVLSSKWNKLFGIHNDVLGLMFYIVAAIIASLLVIEVAPLHIWNYALVAMVSGAALMSLFLVYLQWKVIKEWCFWCLMSAGTIACMTIILIAVGFNLMP